MERRIAAAQQRLDGEAERLKRAVAAVEEEGAALKASVVAGGPASAAAKGTAVGFKRTACWLCALLTAYMALPAPPVCRSVPRSWLPVRRL